MTDNDNDAHKIKKPKRLVPVVQGRQRKAIKKQKSPTTVHRQQPTSGAFLHELVEAANSDAAWQTGTAPLRQRGRAPLKTHLAFGGSKSSKKYEEGTPITHHRSLDFKREFDRPKQEEDHFDDDVARPICLRPRSEEDAEKLLPRYLEDRIFEMSSDEDDADTPESMGLGSTSGDGGILFQLPSAFPYVQKKIEGTSDVPPLPEGKIGTLSIYKSGRVRLTTGDVSMDVGGGTPWPFHQQLVAVNVRESDGHCVFLGQIEKHAVCTLDLTDLLREDAEEGTHNPSSIPKEAAPNVVIDRSTDEAGEVPCKTEGMELDDDDDVTDAIEVEIEPGIDLESIEGLDRMKVVSNERTTNFLES